MKVLSAGIVLKWAFSTDKIGKNEVLIRWLRSKMGVFDG